MGINTGDRVTFVVEDGTVRVVNSAIYALQRFQAQMKGEGKAAGLMNDDDVAAWITASRREEEAEWKWWYGQNYSMVSGLIILNFFP